MLRQAFFGLLVLLVHVTGLAIKYMHQQARGKLHASANLEVQGGAKSAEVESALVTPRLSINQYMFALFRGTSVFLLFPFFFSS